MPEIHPTAIVDAAADMAADVRIGAYAIVEAGVQLGAGTVVHEHSILRSGTIVGERCKIGPAAYLGLEPQHSGFRADPATPTFLVVGNDVIVRETATLHRAFVPGLEHATRIGDRCFIMAAAHVGHDSVMEPDAILAHAALLGGHTHIGRGAFIGGGATVHQHVRVGRLAMIGGNEAFTHDAPPFAAIRYGRLKGYNAIGCKRSGMPARSLKAIRDAYRVIHNQPTVPARLQEIRRSVEQTPEVVELLAFIESSKRGIVPSFSAKRNVDADLPPD